MKVIGRKSKNVLDVVYSLRDWRFWAFGKGHVGHLAREKVIGYLKRPAIRAVAIEVSNIVDEQCEKDN